MPLPKVSSAVIVPPIKCQGIKTKLVPFIAANVAWDAGRRWIEPFLGSGVVDGASYLGGRQGVADVLVAGRFGKYDADDGAIFGYQRAAGIARNDIGLQLVDVTVGMASAVDVAATSRELGHDSRRVSGERATARIA